MTAQERVRVRSRFPSSICDVETRTEEEGLTLGFVVALEGDGGTASWEPKGDPPKATFTPRNSRGPL